MFDDLPAALQPIYALAVSYSGFLILGILLLLLLSGLRWLVTLGIWLGLAFGAWLLLTQVFGFHLDPEMLYHKLTGAG